MGNLSKQTGGSQPFFAESGNIFFALFGAVAMVGVIGAATSQIMAGPLAVVVRVNNDANNTAKMQMAAHSVLKAAAAADTPDCDGDGVNEPLAPNASYTAMTGAGGLPQTGMGIGGIDAYGTPFAYCAWDHGTVDPANCPGLRKGDATAQIAVAIISAGPDKVFSSQCLDAPGYFKLDGDDKAEFYTPAMAGFIAGGSGLWVLDKADDKATINKDLKVTTDLSFSASSAVSFDTEARLNMAGLFFLPDQSQLSICNTANKGALRRNTTDGTEVMEICDGTFQRVGATKFSQLIDGFDLTGHAGEVVRVADDEQSLQPSPFDFLSLVDTPDSYAGAAGKILAVGSGEDGPNYAANMTYNDDGNLILAGNGAVKVPTGTVANRPAGLAGMIRYNTQTMAFEGHNGTAWASISGEASEPGASTFLDLTDTPSSYVGQAGKVVTVKADEKGVEYQPNGGTLTCVASVQSAQQGNISVGVQTWHRCPATYTEITQMMCLSQDGNTKIPVLSGNGYGGCGVNTTPYLRCCKIQ